MEFRDLLKSQKLNLKPCKTTVKDALGRRYELVDGVKKELALGVPFVVDEKPDLQLARITPGLFLSSQDPTANIGILKGHGIRHVLSLGIEASVKFDDLTYHHCELLDLPESDILPAVKRCARIIHEYRGRNILVHCNAGVSRSPTIVIAYLMALEGLPYEDAFDRVKGARGSIKPNEGFVRQLKTLDLSDIL